MASMYLLFLKSTKLSLLHARTLAVSKHGSHYGPWSCLSLLYPRSTRGGLYCFTSVRPSVRPKIFFSATIDGRNPIFGHKFHIGTPYHGKRFWTRHIPTSCLPTWLVFIHIEHICGGIISEH